MSFFYHSPLGMIYFIILSVICGLAIWRGKGNYRFLAASIAAVFLCDRVLLATISDEAVMIGLGGIVEFGAFLAVVTASLDRATMAVAFLFIGKVACYILLMTAVISFGTMAAWTELAGYLQLLIIGAGAAHVDRGTLATIRDALGRGSLGHGVHSLAKRLSLQSHPRMPSGRDSED